MITSLVGKSCKASSRGLVGRKIGTILVGVNGQYLPGCTGARPDPAFPLLGNCPEVTPTTAQKHLCTKTFIAAWPARAIRWKQSMCSCTGGGNVGG